MNKDFAAEFNNLRKIYHINDESRNLSNTGVINKYANKTIGLNNLNEFEHDVLYSNKRNESHSHFYS